MFVTSSLPYIPVLSCKAVQKICSLYLPAVFLSSAVLFSLLQNLGRTVFLLIDSPQRDNLKLQIQAWVANSWFVSLEFHTYWKQFSFSPCNNLLLLKVWDQITQAQKTQFFTSLPGFRAQNKCCFQGVDMWLLFWACHKISNLTSPQPVT